MAYTSLVEALGEQKRRAKLQGRPPTTGEVRGVSEGYFGAQAGKQLQQRELAQRETLQATDIEAKKELQATELAKQRELQAEQLAQQKKLEENRLAEVTATRQAQMAAADKAERSAQKQQQVAGVAAGAAIGGYVAAGTAVGGPWGAVIGAAVGYAVSSCVVFNYLYGPTSKQVRYARIFCARFMTKENYHGYIHWGEGKIALWEKHPWRKVFDEYVIVKPFFQYMLWKLDRAKPTLWQRLVGWRMMQKAKRLGKRTDLIPLRDKHQACVQNAGSNLQV